MIKFVKIRMSRLLKLELPQLGKSILSILKEYDLEELNLEKAFLDFNNLKPEMEKLVVRYGPHPITSQLPPLREKRFKYVMAIAHRVEGAAQGYVSGPENYVVEAKIIVDRFFRNIRANNEEVINERIEQFFYEYSINSRFQEFVSQYDLSPYLDGLEDAHSDLKELLEKRNKLLSQREKGISFTSRQAVINGINDLFDRIRAAQLDNRETDYNPLIEEVNEKLIRYGALIKSRNTLLKNKQDVSDESNVVQGAFLMPLHTASNDEMKSVFTLENGEDKEKAAAIPTKQTQLPTIEA